MKRLLNTLYVTTEGAYLKRDGETVLVQVERETRLRIPIHTLGGIVCFHRVVCSAPLMGFCAERGVALSYLNRNGRFLARVQGPVSGNVLLRREQYRRADDETARTEAARAFLTAKILNARTVLMRAARENPSAQTAEALQAAGRELARVVRIIDDNRNDGLDTLRGHEGRAGALYFGVFDHLITGDKKAFFFRGRNRRPPLDNVNALLSFLYTLLVHDVAAALETVGLDPAVGFLHRDRPGRPGLALDLMEELRPFLADRCALSLVNRRQVKGKGFKKTETGAVSMNDATRKEVLVQYQKRKQETIQHPFLDEKIEIGLIPHAQAMLLARHLRGDLDAYPPFLWK